MTGEISNAEFISLLLIHQNFLLSHPFSFYNTLPKIIYSFEMLLFNNVIFTFLSLESVHEKICDHARTIQYIPLVNLTRYIAYGNRTLQSLCL